MSETETIIIFFLIDVLIICISYVTVRWLLYRIKLLVISQSKSDCLLFGGQPKARSAIMCIIEVVAITIVVYIDRWYLKLSLCLNVL